MLPFQFAQTDAQYNKLQISFYTEEKVDALLNFNYAIYTYSK